MLYFLFEHFNHDLVLLNLLRYITLRSGGALLTALIITIVLMPKLIRTLRHIMQEGQPIRDDGPAGHLLTKKGTPTMGGLMILFATIFSTILWGDLHNQFLCIVMFVTVSYGFLGFIDDYIKVTKQNTKGVSRKGKLLAQFAVAIIACVWIQQVMPTALSYALVLPILKNTLFYLGFAYALFVLVVIVGASNAVNLTDGLDGLAIMPIIIAAGCFALITYVTGHAVFSNYLNLYHIEGTSEVAVYCCALIGAGLGFLWYNAQPAEIFMGDTGSLALGGAIGTISVITKQEFVLAIIGGLFVMEAMSVIIQIAYFRFTGGKRIFLMAPLHHHFEKLGWSESRVVIRFWIIAVIFAILGLAMLKIR